MNEAVLVIDVQNEYFTGKLPIMYPPGSFENILAVMDHAHAAHIPVAAIQHTNPAPAAATFRKGTNIWELHDDIKRRPADIILEKNMPVSFTGTILDEWL